MLILNSTLSSSMCWLLQKSIFRVLSQTEVMWLRLRGARGCDRSTPMGPSTRTACVAQRGHDARLFDFFKPKQTIQLIVKLFSVCIDVEDWNSRWKGIHERSKIFDLDCAEVPALLSRALVPLAAMENNFHTRVGILCIKTHLFWSHTKFQVQSYIYLLTYSMCCV